MKYYCFNRYTLTKLKKIKLFYLHCSCETLLSNQIRRMFKGIKNTSPEKSGNPETLKINRNSSKASQLMCP